MTKKQLLTREQEIDLHRRIQHGDEDAFQELVLANLGLAVYIVKKLPHWNLASSMTRQDLIQEANLALMQAARTWKPTHRFATYARSVVCSKVFRKIEQLENLISIPIGVQEAIRRLYKITNHLIQEKGREPTLQELVEASGQPYRDVQELLLISQRQPISLDAFKNDKAIEESIDHD